LVSLSRKRTLIVLARYLSVLLTKLAATDVKKKSTMAVENSFHDRLSTLLSPRPLSSEIRSESSERHMSVAVCVYSRHASVDVALGTMMGRIVRRRATSVASDFADFAELRRETAEFAVLLLSFLARASARMTSVSPSPPRAAESAARDRARAVTPPKDRASVTSVRLSFAYDASTSRVIESHSARVKRRGICAVVRSDMSRGCNVTTDGKREK